LALARSSSAAICVVLGNEACDLDSVASALVHAQLNVDEPVALPLLQCRRAEFRLRGDSRAALRRVGIDEAERSLLFLHDDVSIDELRAWHDAGRLRLALVDHNRCTLPAPLAAAVRQVLDHHVDERRYVDDSLQLKCVRPTGSCATLVAQLAAHRLVGADADAAAAQLLLSAIVTDTINFDPKLNRTTPLDMAIARFLFDHSSNKSSSAVAFDSYCNDLFAEISRAKNDVSSLTPLELLQRDYKAADAPRLGFASLTLPLADFLAKADALAALDSFCAAQRLDTLVLCVALTEPTFRRQLALFSRDTTRFTNLLSFLPSQHSLALAPLQSLSSEHFACWEQGDLTASRKAIAPLVTSRLLLLLE
jgi:inorganic pyrophosphatase/exopolyphosphatase